MIKREELELKEKESLKPYACFSTDVTRSYDFKKHPIRTEFQRDRDRIIHSKAFRRLEYKTQVYLTQKGDHLRTRLTHSLEVAQLGRTIGLQLGLNTDLIEAIALGHDVGHTPFGHVGERCIDEQLMGSKGTKIFKHNVQSVRMLEKLEKKYNYNGLSLTHAVLEGILKHTSMPDNLPRCCNDLFPNIPFSVTLEGQVVAIADEIAQMTHDMDDYLRYNIVELNNLLEHNLFEYVDIFNKQKYKFDIKDCLKSIEDYDIKKEIIIRCLVDYLTTILIEQSEDKLNDSLRAYSLQKVYIDYDENIKLIVNDFHNSLDNLIFADYRIKEMDRRGEDIVKCLFKYYVEFPKKLPKHILRIYSKEKNIAIADYIAGMTDRFAINLYDSIIDIGR